MLAQSNVGARGHHQFQKDLSVQPVHSHRTTPLMHTHDYTEMLYVLEGEFEHCVEDRLSLYKKGQVCILNKNEELFARQHGQSQMIQVLLVRLFTYFVDYPEYYTPNHVIFDAQSRSHSYTFSLIARCIEQCSGRPTRQYLEQHVGYCGDYINRIIKKHSGMSLREYIRSITLTKAEQMLRHTDESISKIIAAIGFENKTYFYTLFKDKYGMTPLKYRKIFRHHTAK